MAKYRIKLTQEEVIELRSILKKGSHTSQTYKVTKNSWNTIRTIFYPRIYLLH